VADPLPDLHVNTDGRFVATCGGCLTYSAPMSAASAEEAWGALQREGWAFFRSQYGGRGYARCRACNTKGGTVDEAVARAKKGRKRR
jgi:hypothetical protein